MFLSGSELIDIFITVVAASFIFSDFLEPLRRADSLGSRMLRTAMIAAPAIVLHELGHKFVAMAFGLTATFHAAYLWLAIGVALKLVRFPFIFLVPAYVSIVGAAGVSAAAYGWSALAGPLVNAALALGCYIALKVKHWPTQTTILLYASQQINLFLFVFNLLPIPGFDGSHVWSAFF
jgi:Zn-dependent protease